MGRSHIVIETGGGIDSGRVVHGCLKRGYILGRRGEFWESRI